MIIRRTVVVVGLLGLVVLAGCTAGAGSSGTSTSEGPTGGPTAVPSAAAPDLTIFAAASLRSAMEAAIAAYEQVTPEATITLATDSSSALRTQIEQGAPADVFLSADTTNPQILVDSGLADGEAVAFAGNELAIIVPSDDPGAITDPADLGRAGVRIVAAAAEVPVTRYALRLVANLADLDGYPADFASAYDANIVSREDNVAAVVAKIRLGEGDAGIVYATDAAAAADAVKVVEVPAAANVRATYAGVVVSDTAQVEAAHAFLAWLVGADGQAVLAGFGFLPPPS